MVVDWLPENADSVGPDQAARRYRAAWRASNGRRPDPADFLSSDAATDPSALQSLLLADLALRREAGEPARVEEYRDRFPGLDVATLAALLYEEYCLSEEAGERPDAADYEARFPAAAAELRQILEIHSLVRSGRSAPPGSSAPVTAFPEVGQTIAGFRLVEELGRGTFARVFRAEERRLADRPVALKVTRAASREPQALARLQHTHIVPVYSYLTDPVSGLHLLCMPYLGRVTLADVLARPRSGGTRTGADLVAALDEFGAAGNVPAGRSAGRLALTRRGYDRALAWWVARLAEALQHAHERGVLHRDVKPSNILIAGDGLPMLLDFNLAQESCASDFSDAPSALGGTLAYMAPEHLEALADGATDRVDGRADIYALGVVLFEALTGGTHPFAPPSGAATVPERLRRAAAERMAGAPRLRAARPETPPELEAVVRRCLEPDPADRYGAASELAADLQAVADDAPLRFAPEPLPGRLRRWLRRRRRPLALATPPLLALAALAFSMVDARLARLRIEAEIGHEISEGEHAFQEDQLDRAAGQFAAAARLASGDPRLRPLQERATERNLDARRSKEVRDRADALFRRAEPLRFGLLGFGGDPVSAVRGVEEALRLFSIPDDDGWAARSELRLLDKARRDRLLAEVDELLFLWVVALDRGLPGSRGSDRRALRICDAARPFAAPGGPWPALRERYAARLDGRPPKGMSADPRREESARACFQWGLLRRLEEGPTDAAIAWLERAVQLRPGDYWPQFYLGYRHDQAGRTQRAIEHYDVAVALRPDAPWALFNRARLCRQQGDWDRARADLDRALASTHAAGFDFPEARLESGIVRQYLGDAAGARSDYGAVISAVPGGPYARAARLNRAKLDLNDGAAGRARAAYDALLNDDQDDASARLGRALLALRLGQAEQAEADLTRLLRDAAGDEAEARAHRAVARLALGRTADAVEDAAAALRLQPTLAHERLWLRSLLAARRDRDLFALLGLDDPDELDRLPVGGPALAADARAAAGRLLRLAGAGEAIAAPALRTRAALLAALGDARANQTLAGNADSPDDCLVRARIRRRAGDRLGALADLKSGLVLAPGDPRLLELRGLLQVELGRPGEGLADLERALLRGARGTARSSIAEAFAALGRDGPALEAWTLALAYDAENPHAYLGRAQSLVRLGRWDHALADLERAAEWSGGRAGLLARIALAYASCLPARPDRLHRVLGLARQAGEASLPTSRPPVGRGAGLRPFDPGREAVPAQD